MRHREYGERGLQDEGGGDEIAGGPDFVEVIEGGGPGVGKFGEFPGEIADVVFAGAEGRAVVVVDIARGGGISRARWWAPS